MTALIFAPELARRLGTSNRTALTLLRDGPLGAKQVGDRLATTEPMLDAYLRTPDARGERPALRVVRRTAQPATTGLIAARKAAGG